MMASFDVRRIFGLPAMYDAFQDFVGANALKKRFIETYVPSSRPIRLLEIGCGPGKNLDYLPRSVDYVGCDVSEKYIEYAKKRYGNIAQFYCMSVADLGKLDIPKFDVILSVGVLHHISDDLIRSLGEASKGLLSAEGYFLALEPCWTDTQSRLNRTIMSYDRGEYIRRMTEYSALLGTAFKRCEAKEIETRDLIIYPTSACVIQAFR